MTRSLDGWLEAAILEWQYTPYAAFLFLAAAVVLGLAAYLVRYRGAPGAVALAAMLVAAGVWDLGAGLELSAAGLDGKLLWAKFQYLGIATIAVAWLAFSLQYTGRERWLSRRRLALLCVPPAVTLLLVATNEAHGLIWPATELVREDGIWDLRLAHGAGFWVQWGYSYVLLLIGTVLLVSTLLRPSRLYRMQGAVLLLGVAAPWAGNAIYVSGLSPLGGKDLTPFGFLVCGAAMTWGLTRFRLLDVVPIARYAVFDHMNEGVLVLDLRERVVDINLAAKEILRLGRSEIVGMEAGTLLRRMQTVPGTERECGSREVSIGEGEERRNYAIESSRVLDKRGEQRGVILLLRDNTEKQRAQEALRQSEERYRAVVEQAAEGIFLCDVRTRCVIESNAALQRLLGYTAGELQEMRLYDLIEHDPASVDDNIRRIEERDEYCVGERRYRRKDGALLDLAVSASLISYGGREIICIVVRDITSQKALERRLEHRASHDHLTDLPNRMLFMQLLEEALERCAQQQSEVGLLFMDLDNFKEINDSLGHDFGDRLLIEVASRIGGCLRPGEFASRFGGDEFTAMLQGISSVEEAAAVARRIEKRLREPFVVAGRGVEISASIGVVVSGRAGASESAASLIHEADLAMYGAKKDAASGIQVSITGPRKPGARLYIVPRERNARIGSSAGKKTYEPDGAPRIEAGGLDLPDSSLDLRRE